MLHILLLILKFIGIIIAAILGILVLLVCIVLFVPVRYEIRGKSGGDLNSLKGKIKVTWFLHLFRADVYYKEKRLRWRIRLAFFKRNSDRSKETAGMHNKHEMKEDGKQKKGGTPNEEKHDENVEAVEEVKNNESISKEDEKTEEAVEETAEEECEADEKTEAKEKFKEDTENPESKGNRFLQKIKALCKKIKCTFLNICDKINTLREKKDKLIEFVEDEVHRNAFARVKKELFWYLRKLKPKKLESQIRFGFEDPSYTGKTLAYLSVLYPFFGEYMEIIPDFEQKILKGSLYVKGRIRASHLVHLAWKLFWDKNIRKSYKHIKEFSQL